MAISCLQKYQTRPKRAQFKQNVPIKPHDPRDRVVLGTISARIPSTVLAEWQVRALDPAGPFHHYFAKNDMLHLQFWNPYFGISVLTPSKLTANRFEAYPLSDWKLASESYETLRVKLECAFATRLPVESLVNQLTGEFREAVNSAVATGQDRRG